MYTKIVYKATLLLLLFLVGCSEQNKSRQTIRQEVARWNGKQIHLPSEAVFMRYTLNTVPFTPDTEYKILMYTDSGGCTSYKLPLPKWKEMLALTDSLLPGKISYLFFFDNADWRKVRYLLKQVLTNRGQESFVLFEAIADCGCAEAVCSHMPLPPGKSTSVEVRFTPTVAGTFGKTIRLYH